MTTFVEAKAPLVKAGAAAALVLAVVAVIPVTAMAIEVKIPSAMVLEFMLAKVFTSVSTAHWRKNISGKASYANELLKT